MAGGDKADYCPPERGLVLGWWGGVQEVSHSVYEWMDGWMADRLSGWMLVPRLAGWSACLPTEQACQGTRASLGNAKHDIGTKPTSVPLERGPVLGYRA